MLADSRPTAHSLRATHRTGEAPVCEPPQSNEPRPRPPFPKLAGPAMLLPKAVAGPAVHHDVGSGPPMRPLGNTYYAAVAQGRIEAALEVVQEHVTSAWTGRCLACHQPGPCDTRVDADDTLHRYRRLPKRTPGASLFGSANRPLPSSSFVWFGVVVELER